MDFNKLYDIQCFLKERLFYAKDLDAIVFTGSTILKLLGLINRESKDLDVILIGGSDLKEQTFKYLFNSDDAALRVEDHERYDIVERYGVIEHGDISIEIFVQLKEERNYITIAVDENKDKYINISIVYDMFKKKWQYNKDKAAADIKLISQHLQNSNNEISASF